MKVPHHREFQAVQYTHNQLDARELLSGIHRSFRKIFHRRVQIPNINLE